MITTNCMDVKCISLTCMNKYVTNSLPDVRWITTMLKLPHCSALMIDSPVSNDPSKGRTPI